MTEMCVDFMNLVYPKVKSTDNFTAVTPEQSGIYSSTMQKASVNIEQLLGAWGVLHFSCKMRH